MNNPSADKMRSMIDVVDQHLRMLKRFDMDTDSWSPMVCVILLGKLDTETRNQWESKDALPIMPDLNALFNYLEQRILAIRNVELSDKQGQALLTSQNNGQRSIQTRTIKHKERYRPYEHKSKPDVVQSMELHMSNTKGSPICKQCNNGSKHFLWQCDAFKQLPCKEMMRSLAQWKICEVCLVAQHHARDCKKGMCPICKNGKHNSLICPFKTTKSINHLRPCVKSHDKQTTE